MRVSSVYESNPWRGRDVYIVGLGPSMRMFPAELLEGKQCCLLNDGWRYFPDLTREGNLVVSCALRHLDGCTMESQVVKGRKKWSQKKAIVKRHDNHVPWDHPDYLVFSFLMKEYDGLDSFDPEVALWSDPDYYWRGQTVASYAIQFLAQCGVRSITMVGCDCAALGEHDYLARIDHIRLSERSKAERRRKAKLMRKYTTHDYPKYLETLEIMRRAVWDKFKIPILSLTPFVGTSDYDRQYREMMSWRTQ